VSRKKENHESCKSTSILSTKPTLVAIELLKAHEEVDKIYHEKLKKIIESDRVLKKPVVADINTYIILDGHHRVSVLRSLGCRFVPVVLVDYNSPYIIVESWRNMKIDKETVLSRALNGKMFPPKTTKHMIQINGKLKHISFIQKAVNVPLDALK